MRVDEGEAITALQVFERHSLDQCRLSGTGLPDDVVMQKAVFFFYAEDASVITKIGPTNT